MRWEVGTAIAGLLLKVNPFDEPDVKLAKEATREVLKVHQRDGVLPIPAATAVLSGARLTLGDRLAGATDPWAAAVGSMRPGDYVAVLGYAPPEDVPFGAALDRLRARLGAAGAVAATGGYGPRYLHSTGQLHKGGPNTGVFVIISTDADADLPIPESKYTFGVLEAAQALGDYLILDGQTFNDLTITGGPRRVVSVHLPRRDPALLDQITDALTRAL
jgi:transaldolase / glucose-6-phosphate isomerase